MVIKVKKIPKTSKAAAQKARRNQACQIHQQSGQRPLLSIKTYLGMMAQVRKMRIPGSRESHLKLAKQGEIAPFIGASNL
jgi:hypothetical protein